MGDLIDRQALLRWFDNWYDHDEFCVGYITAIIGEQPPVDAVEVAQPNLQPTCNQLATDCISRQAAIKAIEELIKVRLDWLTDTRPERQGLNAAMCAIGDLPSTDAVEIVRCRDCKHNPNDTWFECPVSHLPYNEDRWCWKGERKDG